METTFASEIMSVNILAATEDTTVEEALKILINSKITGMPVINAKGEMIGVVSEYDLLKQLCKQNSVKPKAFKKPIRFSKRVDAISAKTTLEEIVDRFIVNKFRRLPVVDENGKLVGIITRRDLIRVFYYRSTFP
jgi:CBS-domain-containing membrane protein